MIPTTKKFGKHTYELQAVTHTLTAARKEIKEVKEAGFTRARYTMKYGTKESHSTFLYFIWIDISSNKRLK
jgi:hypothetical protein